MTRSHSNSPSSSPDIGPHPPDKGESPTSHLPAAPETVLLAVTGMSPAVLTETVWALAHQPEPVIPARVVVVTTIEGRNRIAHQLFEPSPRFAGRTPWQILREALTAAGHPVEDRLRFGTTADDIRVITTVDPDSARSRELADIRTPSDNEAAADFLLEQVRQFVENSDIHLIASVAGGRKTMGALLYACLTLAGRETDRLTHVLVNEPFETTPEFFFPAQPGGVLPLRDGSTLDPGLALVELADVPFVPLRNLFVRELRRTAGTFSRLIDTCREQVRSRAARTLKVIVDTRRPRIEVNGHEVIPSPREHLLFLFLAQRARDAITPLPDQVNALDPLNAFREDLRADRPAEDLSDWRHDCALAQKIEAEDIRKILHGLRRKLKNRGGDAALLASCLPQPRRFSLELEPSLVYLR